MNSLPAWAAMGYPGLNQAPADFFAALFCLKVQASSSTFNAVLNALHASWVTVLYLWYFRHCFALQSVGKHLSNPCDQASQLGISSGMAKPTWAQAQPKPAEAVPDVRRPRFLQAVTVLQNMHWERLLLNGVHAARQSNKTMGVLERVRVCASARHCVLQAGLCIDIAQKAELLSLPKVFLP